MNFDAIPLICDETVEVSSPFATPPARKPRSIPGGNLTPGCDR